MTSDLLDISFVWKLLCVCLRMKFKHAFSTCSSPMPKVFISRPAQTHLSLVINTFACSVLLEAISLLAINMFVCSVILCSEVSSRGYLVASDDMFICSVILYLVVKRVVFENWFRNPPKVQKLVEKSF